MVNYGTFFKKGVKLQYSVFNYLFVEDREKRHATLQFKTDTLTETLRDRQTNVSDR